MEAAAADLLAALSSPSHAGLHSRFAAYLHPFSPHLLAANPPTPDAASVRPLAKRFLPFLSRALHLLPPLLRQNPSSVSASDADELLEIYGLLLDCLAAISPCLAGKPYSVLLQRGRFVCCLQSRGHYARAEAEAAATLDALRCALSPAAIGAASLLPEPAGVAGEDPEITTLAVELTVCLANCASKAKVKEAGPYQRVLLLVEQLRPWLRILTEESSRKKYLTLLVDALSRCVVFLAAEPPFFDEKLVREFCVATLGVARKICSSYCRPSARKEGPIITEDLPKDTLKGITDAFARIAKMIDILHKCGSKVTQDIIVKILSESLVYGDTSDYHKSYLVLIKLWVKITLKDFEDDQRVDSATLLYHSLMACSPPLPVKLIGLIVEQELLAYGAMESRVTMLGANMQNRIIDILLNEIYCSKEYYLNRSKVLVRKARIFRASGVQNISSCLESLSEAISLLRDILLDSSRDNAIVIYELAIAYCLHAHCAQEANHGGKVIFDDARSVVDLWSKMDTLHHCSPGVIFQQPPETLVPLLCSLVDLLAVKGCFELQFELCKLIIIVWKQENLP